MRPLYLLIPLAVALGTSAAPVRAHAQVAVDVSITTAPPELPVYDQPPLPAPGYIFMPGYWAYGSSGYYWVPGTWVEPPQPDLLWTPGYWGWNAGQYIFNNGYWGPTVGYYGGINYGFGYGGLGYEGGYWRGGSFFYNSRVNNFGGVHVTNVFERNVTNVTVNHYSFNGPNGVDRKATPAELAAARAPHVPPTAAQMHHIEAAQQNRALLASVNHGRPAVLATPRPAAFGAAHPGIGGAPGGQAVHPHPVTRNAPRPVGALPHPTNAGAPGIKPTSAPHAPMRTAVPRPTTRVAAPHAGTGVPREMAPHAAAPREMAPMHRPVSAPPIAHRAPAATPPRSAPPPKEEKPKR